MKDLPILMSGDMVVATLGDRKTMTRRTRGLEVINKNPDDWVFIDSYKNTYKKTIFRFLNNETNQFGYFYCPYGEAGDRLWVRETWCNINKPHIKSEIYYKADTVCAEDYDPTEWKWKPSIHMFRKDSRILLARTETRVERVKDISYADVEREGLDVSDCYDINHGNKFPDEDAAKYKFELLWDSLNKKRGYGWEKNNWVWVIGYKRIENGQAKKEVQETLSA